MKNLKNKAFTLVELLVVITILSIISVVAYQNFGGAVDKAVNGRKISDVSTIETALQQYKADKNYFPSTDAESTSNLWWYKDIDAQPSNTIKIEPQDLEVKKIIDSDTKWGWKVLNSDWNQIWSKWTISQKTLWKKYLTKDLYDPELGDLIEKNTNTKFIEKWVGRYIYAIYKKWAANLRWNDYNIAFTLKKDNSDKYISKISGSYDKESCYEDAAKCPDSLIGSWTWSSRVTLIDWEEQKLNASWLIDTTMENQWIPYAVTDFAQ